MIGPNEKNHESKPANSGKWSTITLAALVPGDLLFAVKEGLPAMHVSIVSRSMEKAGAVREVHEVAETVPGTILQTCELAGSRKWSPCAASGERERGLLGSG